MAKNREEFNDKYKWNTKDIYKSDELCLKDIKYLEKKIKEYRKFKDHILDSSDNLLKLLELDTNIGIKLEQVFIYAHINNDADTLNQSYQELFGQAKNLYSKYLEESAYIVPELLKSDEKIVLNYIKENKSLKEYSRVLKNIYRTKKHVLSSEVEASLGAFAKLMDAPDEIMSSMSDSDFRFDNIVVDGKSVELTESNYSVFIRSNDREVRKQAFESLYKTYSSFKTTIATILRNEVEKSVANAKIRKYKNTLEASLFHDEIKPQVYHNLINSVHNNLFRSYSPDNPPQ